MADPKEWSPKFDEEQIRGVIDQYVRYPELFNDRDDDIQALEDHAHYYRIPFARNKEHQEAFVSRTLKQFGQGWTEGFTTLPPPKFGIGREPEDTWEGIAHNLGHLSGFVGYLPGGKTLRKLGFLKTYSRIADGIRGKSAPMLAANAIQKRVNNSIEPILKDLPDWATSGIVPDMASGAFHLGTASAISSWTHGVDEMFHAAGFGAVAGGAFRGIGNLKGFGERISAGQLKPNGSPDFSKISAGQKFDLAMRTTAGMAFQGLPSTLQGATTEEQVYQYAMGAFFGFKEIPYQTRTSREFLAESIKEKYGPDPELSPKWDTLTKEMKEIVRKDFQETFQYSADGPSETSHVLFDILSNRGMNLKQIEDIAEQYRGAYEVDPVTGEVNQKTLSPKEVREYKEAYMKDPRFEDPQDLDMHIAEIQEVPGRLMGKNGYIDQVYPQISTVERIDRSNAIWKKWRSLQNEDAKPIPGAEQKIINFIENSYQQVLTESEKGWWRRWAETNRKQKWVEQIEVADGKVRVLEEKTNKLGNTKNLSQEPLIIEEGYRNEYERVNRGKKLPPEDQFFRVLDHIIYGNKEYDLSRAQRGISQQKMVEIRKRLDKAELERLDWDQLKEMADGEAARHMKKVRKAVAEKMWEDGYYYYGGKGDNKKMYFIKQHPSLVKNRGIYKTVLKNMAQVMRKKGVTDFRRKYTKDKNDWMETYGHIKDASKMYDKIYASNILYDLTMNGFSVRVKDLKKGLETVLNDKEFINDPKAFNKRQQIWFNSGLSANERPVIDYIRNNSVNRDISITDPNFKVGLFSEADGRKVKLTDGAEKYAEISDGAIIAREEVVDALNIDKGLPTSGKMNKSFIVAPDPKLGALLGKYAIHIASPELQRYMETNGIHMLMPKSAVKQTGKRLDMMGELYISPDFQDKKFDIEFNGQLFDVPVRSFRTIMSEITSEKFLKRQQVPKQMYSVLSQYGHKSIDPKVIADMFETLSGRAVNGTEEGMEMLREHMSKPTEKTTKDIVENLDQIPLRETFNILRDAKQEGLAQKIYEKILKVNAEVTENLAAEGEIPREQELQIKKQNADYEGVIERMGKLFPDGSIGAYLHKFSRDYRMQALRNYVVNRLTRPQVDNSASSRMRPWEVGLQLPNKKTEVLSRKEGQDVFFLDDGFKELRIKDEIFGKDRMTLGKLWDIVQNNYKGYENFQGQINDILTAVVMRVPMDSISGAHGLKFGGFTGIKGMGSLLHPRTMRALGGADLDGDKATIFFGGESNGFKKSWRKMYEGSKDEYLKDGGTREAHNKNEIDPVTGEVYAEQLAKRDPALEMDQKHPASQYSPFWREYMSKGAYEGRDMLGVAVTRRMAILGAYNSIRGMTSPEGRHSEKIVLHYDEGGKRKSVEDEIILTKDKYSVPYMAKNRAGEWVKRRIIFQAKKSEKDLQRFREMARAAIALGSDPMDEAGLKGEKFEPKMLDALFEYKIYDVVGKNRLEPNKQEMKLMGQGYRDYLKQKSLHKKFLHVNSVLYGRNHMEGRRHSFAEIQSGARALDFLPKESKNTFLPQLADRIKELNWSDSMFKHVNGDVLNRIYFEHKDLVRDSEWLKDAMGRSTLKTEMGDFIQKVLDAELWTRAGRQRIGEFKKTFDEWMQDGVIKIPWNYREADFTRESVRLNFLENVNLKAEDFLTNDLSDMASLKSISDVARGMDPRRISDIHSKVDEIKSKTVYMARKRREMDEALRKMADLEHVKLVGDEGHNAFKEIPIKRNLNSQLKKARDEFGFNDKASAMNDRVATDALIRRYKKNLSQQEKDLFDMLYIGTFSKGNRKMLERMQKMEKAMQGIEDPEVRLAFEQLKRNAMNTSLIREGVNSKEISDANLKKYFSNFNQLIKKTRAELNDSQKELLMREADGKEPITKFMDNEGNEIKGEFIDANQIGEKDIKYLDEIRPFTRLYEGKVRDPELRRLYDSLTEHLEHYHNIDNINLNGFFRGIFKKNINEATKLDLQQLDRIFKDMRDGTWWRKTMDWMTGKDKNPQIKRAYYWMFPKAVDRDLMRNPAMMEWVEDVGPYKDHLGNTFENARTVRPTSVIGTIQQLAHRTQELSMQKYEEESARWRDELRPYVSALKDGDILFEIAVAKREMRYVKDKLRKKYKDSSSDYTSKEMPYVENWNKVKKEYEALKNKNYIIPLKEGNIQKTGEQVINSIDNLITINNRRTRDWLTGKSEHVNKWLDISQNSSGEITWKGVDRLRKEFHKYIMKTVQEQKSIPIEEIGVDGMRQIVKRIQISQVPNRLRTWERLKELRKSLEVTPFDETGDLGADYYFPHMSFNRKSAKNKLKGALKKIVDDPALTPEEVAKESKKIMHQYKKMTGDFMSRDEMGDNFNVMQDVLTAMANGKRKKAEHILSNDLKRVGNQFSRDAHIGGWELTPEAYEVYMKNITNTFYKQAMQLSARTSMHNFNNSFYKKTKDGDLTNAWMKFFELYTQSAMGYPTHIPERVMNDPLMKIKGTAYKWLADSTAKKRINRIGKALGIGRKELERMNLDEKTIDELSGIEYTQLQGWGALEAKWQLSSLLAHPKSSIANLYGGTVHTWISTGYENLKNARNFDYLKTNVNPKWGNMKDVERWLQSKGIIEEFLVHEAGLNPQLKGKRNQQFIKNAIAKIKRDPNFSDESFLQLARKHGITDRAFAAASSFMRVPERILRRDSFMAHYLQAKELFGGAIRDFDSPFLINYAKKGVKGTQFLYSAPFRPMFTNSTLGRVFSRFQLWSWNSVRFRNDVIRRAKIAGFREGTPEFESFQRLAQADLFMLGLSNLFMYSLFESSLPAPWNWFQDTADWLMGDEKERDRAFFGSPLGPIQAVTPPSFRLLPPMFKWMVSGDSSRLTDYYLWTIPPFGRLVRDVVGPGGIIENPFYTVTKFTGLPLMQAGQLIKQEKPEARRGRFFYG